MIIGTAGHVDHGKTTLVRALTGVDTDRLPEEKRRGMTIDLGYAYAGDMGFIDVPGHERFVHTMLAGSGGIDAVLLAVAADDGVMPQTVEHVQILDLLGVSQGVVAVTRLDRAPERLAVVTRQIRALLAGTALGLAPVLGVSALTGEGLEALEEALAALSARPRESGLLPRLAIDRAFTVAGAGLVVTGTLLAGRIAVGDHLLLSPSGHEVRVRGLHAQSRAAEAAVAGQRVALNLAKSGAGAQAAPARGDWVLHPDAHAPTAQFDIRVRLLPGVRPLVVPTPVHVHLGAAHITGRLAPLGPAIDAGAGGLARLTLERPIGALALDRLVLRDAGAVRTVGGGVVLDPWPPRRGGRTPERLDMLAALEAPAETALAAMLAAGAVDFAAFARARNLPAERREAVLAEAGGVLAGGLALRAAALAALDRGIVDALAGDHLMHPDQQGVTASRLRMMLAERPALPLFAARIEAALRAGRIAQSGPALHLPDHRAVLTAADEAVWEAVAALVGAHPFNPPRTRDISRELALPEGPLRATLHRIARLGRLVEVAHDHFFLPVALAGIIGIIAGLEREAGSVATAAFRDRLGIGRKVAIQVLEFLDGAGVTRREGEARTLRGDRAGRFGPLP